MATDHRKFSAHKAERIVAALKERWKLRRELNRTYAMVGNRPMFTVPLTDEEQWARWQDPALRTEVLASIEKREGKEAVPKYIEHMARLDKKLHTNGATP